MTSGSVQDVLESVDPIQAEIRKAHQDLMQAEEDYLVSIFGSAENVRKYGWRYVLEVDTKSNIEPGDFERNTGVKFRIESTFRIRLKTKEELATTKRQGSRK